MDDSVYMKFKNRRMNMHRGKPDQRSLLADKKGQEGWGSGNALHCDLAVLDVHVDIH